MTSHILVAYGSKHGSTAEIAEKIGQTLHESGYDVDVLPVKKIRQIDQYQAVVLGSGIYIGYWIKAAASFMKKYENDLKSKAVWIFSSGPTGDADVETLLQGWTFPKSLQPVVDRIQPREVVTFHGCLDPKKMNFWERWIINRVNAPLGDFREWEKVVLWAEGIAQSLNKPRV